MRIESSQNTTGKFMGYNISLIHRLIGLINPKKSFIRKRARIHPRSKNIIYLDGKRLKSAAYAI